MSAETCDSWTPPDWRSVFPRGVLDPNGPSGEPITTPTDRRLLWHIEGELAILATREMLRDLQGAVRAYLNETCEHHWTASAGDEVIEPFRQCLWCCTVELVSS